MPQDSLPYIVTNGDTVYLADSASGLKVVEVPYNKEEYSRIIAKEKEYGARTQNEIAYWFSMFSLAVVIVIFFKMMLSQGKIGFDIENHPADETGYDDSNGNSNSSSDCLTYIGKDLRFSNDEVHRICSKYNSYYNKLSGEKKDIFITRLKKFLQTKTFYICSNQGYKEMPVLISAAAIQITFGLDEYLLPFFEEIVIHPQEYMGFYPLRVLEGNVQGNAITLSWKHFLEDYQNPADGKNVGLHEMAHALQVQYLFNTGRSTNEFKEDFVYFDKVDDEIMKMEKNRIDSLFDANALSNTNEFWATSVELFFEKPAELKSQYPDLYNSICLVLNQDTVKI